MFRVFPSVFEFLEIGLGDLAKRPPLGLSDLRGGPGFVFRVEGVLALPDQQARLTGHLSRIGKRDSVQRPEPHLTLAAVFASGPADLGLGSSVAEEPGLVDLAIPAAAHLQPETASIAQQSGFAARARLRIFDLVESQSTDRPHCCKPTSKPTFGCATL